MKINDKSEAQLLILSLVGLYDLRPYKNEQSKLVELVFRVEDDRPGTLNMIYGDKFPPILARFREIDLYVRTYGEQYRELIKDALEWLDGKEPEWKTVLINRGDFICDLVRHTGYRGETK
jgi:hypothetical protein